MILARQADGLGMIPAWQHTPTNPPNIKINNHVKFPEGWNQTTIQPVGAFYASPEPQGSLNGLGASRRFFRSPSAASRMALSPVGCCDLCMCPGTDPCCGGVTARSSMTATRAFRGPMDAFDSPWFQNRKWLVVGGVTLIGLAILGGATALLR